MKRQRLPGYPGLYLRKTLPPFILGVIAFAFGVWSLIEGVLPIAAAVGLGIFILTVFLMVFREYRSLLPSQKACPTCGTMMDRLDEGSGSEIHYDCPACSVRWETGLHVPDS